MTPKYLFSRHSPLQGLLRWGCIPRAAPSAYAEVLPWAILCGPFGARAMTLQSTYYPGSRPLHLRQFDSPIGTC